MSRLRFRCTYGKARKDPEKMVLPGIIFSSNQGHGAKAFVIAAGWWDYHVSLLCGWAATTPPPTDRKG